MTELGGGELDGAGATRHGASELLQTDRSPGVAAITTEERRRPDDLVPRRLRGFLALQDFEPVARRRLPRQIYGYYAGAAETNQSRDDNRDAFRRLAFVPDGGSGARDAAAMPSAAPVAMAHGADLGPRG